LEMDMAMEPGCLTWCYCENALKLRGDHKVHKEERTCSFSLEGLASL